MALQGPYHNKKNDIGATFNGEFKAGVETPSFRFGMYYEIHPAINYSKWTWLAVDYKITDFPFENFALYVGVETSVIYRKFDNAWYGDPNNWRKHQSSNIFNPGANVELQYRLYKKLYLGAGVNIFRAEQVLIDDGKNIRWDGMVSLYWKI